MGALARTLSSTVHLTSFSSIWKRNFPLLIADTTSDLKPLSSYANGSLSNSSGTSADAMARRGGKAGDEYALLRYSSASLEGTRSNSIHVLDVAVLEEGDGDRLGGEILRELAVARDRILFITPGYSIFKSEGCQLSRQI